MKKIIYLPANIPANDFLNGGIPFQDAQGQRIYYDSMEAAWSAACRQMNQDQSGNFDKLACVYTLDHDDENDYMFDSDIIAVRFGLYKDECHRSDCDCTVYVKSGITPAIDYDAARLMIGNSMLAGSKADAYFLQEMYQDGTLDMQSWLKTGGYPIPPAMEYAVGQHMGDILKELSFKDRRVLTACFANAYEYGTANAADALKNAYDEFSTYSETHSLDADIAFQQCYAAAQAYDKQYQEALMEYLPPQQQSSYVLAMLREVTEQVGLPSYRYQDFEARYTEIFAQLPNPTYESIINTTLYASETLAGDPRWIDFLQTHGFDSTAHFVSEYLDYCLQQGLTAGIQTDNDDVNHIVDEMNGTLNTMGLADRKTFIETLITVANEPLRYSEMAQLAYQAVADAHQGHIPPMIEAAFKEEFEYLSAEETAWDYCPENPEFDD